ncbi:PREDICTED: 39S ribosomal protein L15, mitochondrial-like [Priapulus caudatus]|uniref:39S ribosomal protein L15, mitochondrial-like n=1 Tax=Priapulus caudatus TaxID=37621 RepID=A0ABM1EKL1_PRICU|nr:PREDICTED: 39S ribosomal protein L15, mitochondrial-like [Priapulus caudatus]
MGFEPSEPQKKRPAPYALALFGLLDMMFMAVAHAPNFFDICWKNTGADIFQARVHIEVQWTTELTIAAIERAGGVVTTSFYDPISLTALVNPEAFFKTGSPIPRRMLPPVDCVEYYTDARNRGYLSDPGKVAASRAELSQRYGYALPDLTQDPHYKMLTTDKDPRQVFRGLEPGWIVNMADKVVLKPTDDKWQHYYRS